MEHTDIMTVSEVSRAFDVSTRMLSYYEKMGLISSSRRDDYAYRIYDEDSVRRLQQILVLRKLRIPLKQIAVILSDKQQMRALRILRDNISSLDDEIASLNTIRSILEQFVRQLDSSIQLKIRFDLLSDSTLAEAANTLSLSRLNLKEEHKMEELNKAAQILDRKINPRIVLLPPYTVASCHFIGENPEETVGDMMSKFIVESKLYEVKPDARMFGFNHPNPSEKEKYYGYEVWATIPEDMDVPAPLVKKTFAGGLYAAHTIDFPNFGEWQLLVDWANDNDRYLPAFSKEGDENMGGCLEEHINWIYSAHMGWPENGIDGKLDLLIPIKKK